MVKKIIVGTLVVALSVVLIVGAINRTDAKSEQVAQGLEANAGPLAREEARNLLQQKLVQQGRGNPVAIAEIDALESAPRGGGQGRFSEISSSESLEFERRGGEGEASVTEWLEVVGTVVSMNEEELVLLLEDGQEMIVECRAWTYAQELGFTTDIGHSLKLYGFYEGEEFEIGGFEDLTGELFTMVREESGRPLWARGWGREASVPEWLEVIGTGVSVNEEALVLQLQDGQEMVVECRAWTYAQELGFTTDIGHELKLYGFDEDGEFEVGGFEDLTTQLYTMVREESGRPFWAGRWGRDA